MMHNSPTLTLIEDDPVQHMILQRMLSDTYTIQSFHTYHDALNGLGQQTANPPQIILCDINLPDGDGFSLREHIQNMTHLTDCPFIFLTGLENQANRQRAAELGVDDFIKKPITRQDLLTKLHQSLTRNHQLQQIVGDKIDHDLRHILKPSIPKLIGPYRLTIRNEEQTAGGGDFVFHVTHPNGMDYIFIGDTMGHGVPAKFFLHAYTGYLYGLVQATRHYKTPLRPHDILYELNHMIHADDFFQRWQTTCLVLAIGRNGAMEFSTAGHPVPWLITHDIPFRLMHKGMLPGFLPDSTYESCPIHMEKGHRLLLETDGLETTQTILEECKHQNTDQLLEFLFNRTRSNDDATAVVIERV